MPAITLHNVSDDLLLRLEAAAAAHQRSIHDEILATLDQHLVPMPRSYKPRLPSIRAMRTSLDLSDLDPDEIAEALSLPRG